LEDFGLLNTRGNLPIGKYVSIAYVPIRITITYIEELSTLELPTESLSDRNKSISIVSTGIVRAWKLENQERDVNQRSLPERIESAVILHKREVGVP
jgi:hypothetical protein